MLAVLNSIHTESRCVFGADFISGRVKTFFWGVNPLQFTVLILYLQNLKNGVKITSVLVIFVILLVIFSKKQILNIVEADATPYK